MRHAVAALGLLTALALPSLAQERAGRPAAPTAPVNPVMEILAKLEPERQVVEQFDEDDNGRLNAAERQAARAWLASATPTGRAAVKALAEAARATGQAPGFAQLPQFEPAAPGRRVTPADVVSYGDTPLYDPDVLRTIFLEFESDDWEQELAAFYDTDVEVPATVVVDGVTYEDVGVHFRGMSSFVVVPEGSKRSLNLSLDFVRDDQQLLGYSTLNLLNGRGDATFLRGVLYSEIARHYIPVPRKNYVHVVINGESWGIYVNTQQFNADFTREWFGSRRGARWRIPGSPVTPGGMVYLGEGRDQYRRIYEIKSRDDEDAWSDLIRLFRLLNETAIDELEVALSPLLDIDGALKFLALEVALVNTDGYFRRTSDYSLYQDEVGRFHVVPHDIDEGLPFQNGDPRVAEVSPVVEIDNPAKPLRTRLLAVPALRARYLEYVRDIAQTWLDWETLGPLVERFQAVIAEEVAADTRKLHPTEAFRRGVAGGERNLRSFVERRRAYLLEELQ